MGHMNGWIFIGKLYRVNHAVRPMDPSLGCAKKKAPPENLRNVTISKGKNRLIQTIIWLC